MNAQILPTVLDTNGHPKKVWTEFYYPSMVNPGWGPAMEADFRTSLTEQGYVHEVLADFGEETVGVFKKEYIDRAREKYEYINKPSGAAIRVIGVDWDKYGDASQMVVMEYDAERHKFKVLNRVEIPKSNFTLDNGVRKIIELNKTYRPEAIYVDRGYGEYQVEMLHKYGMENPETGMHRKVVGVSFAGAKSVMDPWTRISQNKPIKPFMVNQLTLLFERDLIVINDKDEMIIRQLENYRMLKETINGVPVFTNEDEHTIDCMMLCTLAFIEKFPQIIATVIDYKPATKMIGIQTVAKNPLYDAVNSNEPDMLLRNKKDYLEWDEPGSKPLKRVEVGTRPDRGLKKMYGWSTRGTNMYTEHKRSSW
jgi:replicative DNA helicase